jgi:hypothetical protein
LLAVHRGRNQ